MIWASTVHKSKRTYQVILFECVSPLVALLLSPFSTSKPRRPIHPTVFRLWSPSSCHHSHLILQLQVSTTNLSNLSLDHCRSLSSHQFMGSSRASLGQDDIQQKMSACARRE